MSSSNSAALNLSKKFVFLRKIYPYYNIYIRNLKFFFKSSQFGEDEKIIQLFKKKGTNECREYRYIEALEFKNNIDKTIFLTETKGGFRSRNRNILRKETRKMKKRVNSKRLNRKNKKSKKIHYLMKKNYKKQSLKKY